MYLEEVDDRSWSPISGGLDKLGGDVEIPSKMLLLALKQIKDQ